MLKRFIFLLFIFLPNVLFAYDCSQFKYDADVDIKIKVNDVKTQKSDENLVGKLGYMEPKISYSAMSHNVMIPVHGGFCVSLRGLDIEINEDFNIIIDKRLKEKSCAYDIVYKHEQDHVKAYKNIINDNVDNIKKSVVNGLKNIKPVFVEKENKTVDFIEKINENNFVKQIKSDLLDKIESENQKIDERGDSYHIWKCDDFYKEMKHTEIVID